MVWKCLELNSLRHCGQLTGPCVPLQYLEMQGLQKWCMQANMTGSLNRSQQMAHVRSSLRVPLAGGAAAAAAAMVDGAFLSRKPVHDEVKAKAW